MTLFTEFAPAKVNLTLEVFGRRADGYHEIASLVAFARDAADVVTLDTSRPVGSDVSGPFGSAIAGQNLIDVTLAKLKAAAPQLQLGHVHLVKNLPVAAGIGGGSADAAAVLRAVRRANPDHAETVDWHAIARSLGADVPVCFHDKPAWMTGIGDRVETIEWVPVWAVIVNPLWLMPLDKTAQVFRWLNARPLGERPQPPRPRIATFYELLEFMLTRGNDLSYAACRVAPFIREVERELETDQGCLLAAISGAGPTCFSIFEEEVNAATYAASLQRAHPDWWVRAVTLG
jgi:4-diphosphocytidyl-2-C-methyl-D-erythritol kinase